MCLAVCVRVEERGGEGACEGMHVTYLSALQLATNVKSESWPFRSVVTQQFQLRWKRNNSKRGTARFSRLIPEQAAKLKRKYDASHLAGMKKNM